MEVRVDVTENDARALINKMRLPLKSAIEKAVKDALKGTNEEVRVVDEDAISTAINEALARFASSLNFTVKNDVLEKRIREVVSSVVNEKVNDLAKKLKEESVPAKALNKLKEELKAEVALDVASSLKDELKGELIDRKLIRKIAKEVLSDAMNDKIKVLRDKIRTVASEVLGDRLEKLQEELSQLKAEVAKLDARMEEVKDLAVVSSEKADAVKESVKRMLEESSIAEPDKLKGVIENIVESILNEKGFKERVRKVKLIVDGKTLTVEM